MRFLRWFLAGVLSAALTVWPQSGSSRQYPHPVLDSDFPDPAVLLAPDGWYYAYATQTVTEESGPRIINLQVARSKDLARWDRLGDALPTKPAWARSTQNFYAPHVIYQRGKYVMHYSAELDSKNDFCLGVAVSARPRGPFRDLGKPLKCGRSFTHIDPMAFLDPVSKRIFLYWGSAFGPIYGQELDASGARFKPGTKPDIVLEPRPEFPYMRLIEAAWVTFRDGYYYLYYSGDSCCEPAHYAVMVARSRAPMGPFEIRGSGDLNKSVILKENQRFTAPGHNAIITDRRGQEWIVYHAIDRTRPKMRDPISGQKVVRRPMWRDRLSYVDGWPQVENQERRLTRSRQEP